MEELNNYNIKGFNFAVWFFRLILLLVVTVVVLLFVLDINETVSIKEGEIVAANPQADFKAPFEAQLVRINVKAGQQVNKGDTLLVIRNNEVATQYVNRKAEVAYLEKRIQSIGFLQQAIEKRKAAINEASALNAQKFQLDVNRMVGELETLDDQYELQKERLSSATDRYHSDSILYANGMLSKVEFDQSREAHLASRENLATVRNLHQKQLTERYLANTNFSKEQNSLLLSKVELDENSQALLQQVSQLESQLIQAREGLKQSEAELARQYIIATDAGIVNHVFNTKQTSNLIAKNDLLVSVSPQTVSYYAKAIIPEKDVRLVTSGLDARLKLDAFYQFEHGVIKGRVTYVAERKENEKFYALIQLKGAENLQLRSGYTFRGAIIIRQLPLFRFFIKKLFKRFDSK